MAVPSKPAGAPVGPLPFGIPALQGTGRPVATEATGHTGYTGATAATGAARADALAPRHPQGVLDLVPLPAQTFDNFIVGDNAELVDLLRVDTGAAQNRFFYLWGAPGSGRSHLLHAATGTGNGNGANTGTGTGAGRYMDLREPNSPLGIELLSDAAGSAVIRLGLDNVDALDAGGEQRLFNLCNTVRLEHPQCSLIVSGPLPPAALALRADLVTRLSWGLTYQVHPLTEVQKAEAMAAHARARGAAIGTDVLDWLLQTMPRDLPTLLAVVDSLDQYSLAAKRPATLPLAREWLRSLG